MMIIVWYFLVHGMNGEGNYMEPDLKWGHGYLEALKSVVKFQIK